MTVGDMLDRMSAFEFSMWMAYSRVENEKMSDIKNGKKSPEEEEALQVIEQQKAIGLLEKKGMKSRKKLTAD